MILFKKDLLIPLIEENCDHKLIILQIWLNICYCSYCQSQSVDGYTDTCHMVSTIVLISRRKPYFNWRMPKCLKWSYGENSRKKQESFRPAKKICRLLNDWKFFLLNRRTSQYVGPNLNPSCQLYFSSILNFSTI